MIATRLSHDDCNREYDASGCSSFRRDIIGGPSCLDLRHTKRRGVSFAPSDTRLAPSQPEEPSCRCGHSYLSHKPEAFPLPDWSCKIDGCMCGRYTSA